MYLTILLIIHVVGAIAGIGPTFAFGVLGSLAGKDPQHAIVYLGAMVDIQKKVVTPVALFTQPVTGALLIFESGWNQNFFRHEWLVISIVLYAVILYGSYIVDTPAMHRIVDAMRTGQNDTPQFQKDLRLTQRLGPIFGILTIAIAIMMVWKPGAGA